jgi:hypothetical protein
MSRRELIVKIGAIAGVGLLAHKAWARPKYSDCALVMDVDCPLVVGTLRTTPFAVRSRNYYILLRLRDMNLPWEDTVCLLGTTWPRRSVCNQEPLIEGAWTVWDGSEKAAEGSFAGRGGGEVVEERILGQFKGQSKRNYTLEVHFTKDGGPLKAMKPHLIVRKGYDFWCGPA